MKRRIVKTSSRELYSKLNMLNYLPEVVIKNVTDTQISKIINNINKHDRVLTVEKIGEYFLIKKMGRLDILIYSTTK